jgi:hypothetical protein
MISEIYQYKDLPQKYKNVLNTELPEDKTVYVIKTIDGTPKTITTSVIECIKKVQIH